MKNATVAALRVLLICSSLIMLGIQISSPFVITEIGFAYPRVEPYVVFYSILLILVLALVQVAAFMTWKLLSAYSKDHAFKTPTAHSFSLATIFVGLAIAIAAIALLHLLFVAKEGGPLVPISLLITFTFGATIIFGLLVMRKLLLKSVHNQDELDGTI